MNDDLLVSYLLNEATPAERRQVDEWLAADEQHVKHFNQLKTIWEESKKLAWESNADETIAWEKWKAGLNQVPVKRSVPVYRMPVFRIAAILIFTATVVLLAWLTWNKDQPVPVIHVASNKTVRTDTLPDGSVITLNKNGLLSYPETFDKDIRIVALKGEAYFEVKPDSLKPFIVKVNNISVRVLGTSFNIKAAGGSTEVVVEHGSVQVTYLDQNVLLQAGEKILAGNPGQPFRKEKTADHLYNYYRTRQFVCDNTPLWKLVEVLNEAYDTTIVIDKPALRSLLLTATFNNESLDQVLEVIRVTFDVNIVHTPDKILIR